MTAKGIARITSVLKNTTDLRDEDIRPLGIEEASVKTAAIVKESLVEVEYRKDADGRFVRVKVFSLVKKGLFKYSDIRCDGNSRRDMQRKCGMLGGVLAEQLIEAYGDLVEPSHCAQMAGKHFDELCNVLEKQTSQEAAV